jgi:beta-glucosidase
MSEACVGSTGSIPRLGLNHGLCLQDAPAGIRFADYVSVFPAGGTVAASFDRDLFYQRGLAMGREHRGKGVTVQLGPVAGPIGRSPEGGRNWEGFSPDPVLTGIGMAKTIKGIQDAGVIACAKHFIGNEQEHFRQAPEAVGYGYHINESSSSNIDDKTLHELYAWPFADAVRAGVGSFMCSYNQINNSYGCQNSKLLNGILKHELGFQGFVMSDWQAHHSGVSGALAGLDMSMPGDTVFNTGVSFWGANLTIAVVNGSVPEWRIDDMATRIMAAYFKVGLTLDEPSTNFNSWTQATTGPLHPNDPHSDVGIINQHVNVRANHGQLIRQMAAKSTVLLKNTNNALPLNKPRFVAVIGEDAGSNPWGPNGFPDRGGDDGTLAIGWGSGTTNFPYLITPEAALQSQALLDGSRFESITDNYARSQITALVSQEYVTAIVFVNADSGEGYISVDKNEGDRNNLTMWHDGDALIKDVAAACNNTIVVIHSVGPTLITEWYNNPNVTAIVWAGLPGQESGNSITDILYGKVNPAARSPFTWGSTRESYGTDLLYAPNNGEGAPQVDFTEGVFIDYRSFDARNRTPIYEFGFGLSYTTFNYSNLIIQGTGAGPYTPTSGMTEAAPVLGNFSTNWDDYQFAHPFRYIHQYIYPWLNGTSPHKASADPHYGLPNDAYLPPHATDGSPQPKHPASGAPGGNPSLYDILYLVSVDITNTGALPGEEVPQLYISLGGEDDPPVVLRNFARLSIGPGETTRWIAEVTRRDLSNWDTGRQDWVIGGAQKRVFVGPSSRKLVLSAVLN